MSLHLLGGLLIILLSLAMVGALVYGLNVALTRAGYPSRARLAYRYLVGIALLVYLTGLTVFVQQDYFSNGDALPARVFGLFLAPVGVGIFLCLRRKFRQLLRLLPGAWLVGAQSFRLMTEGVFYLGLTAGFVPYQLTFLGFNQDIAVGVSAILGAVAFFGKHTSRFQIVVWNIFGMLLQFTLLANIILSLPSRWQIFRAAPSADFIVEVPFVWIPGFLMPLAVCLHLFSLVRR